MNEFNKLDGTVLLRRGGVFTVAQLYEREGEVFAKRRSGYIRLIRHGSTSVSNLYWDSLDFDQEVHFPLSRMALKPSTGLRRPKKKAA